MLIKAAFVVEKKVAIGKFMKLKKDDTKLSDFFLSIYIAMVFLLT